MDDRNRDEPSGNGTSDGKASRQQTPSEIRFDYIKSNFFRVVHADGVHGGITGKGGVQIGFFSERKPIPKTETYRIQDGHLAERVREESRDAIVREVEVEVLMNMQMAKSLYDWLGDKLESFEQLAKEKEQSE